MSFLREDAQGNDRLAMDCSQSTLLLAKDQTLRLVKVYPDRIEHLAERALDAPLEFALLSPDGQMAVVQLTDGTLQIFEGANLEPQARASAIDMNYYFAVIGPRAQRAVVVINGSSVLIDLTNMETLADLDTHHQVSVSRFSSNGAWLSVENDDGSVSLWRARSGERVIDIPSDPERAIGVSIAPGERHLTVHREDGRTGATQIDVWSLSHTPN
ncbi:MAG: hypothetical protein ACR2RL_08065 [Gammaproteobacteria bacterium]